MTEDEQQEWNARLIESMNESRIPYDWDSKLKKLLEDE